MNPKYFLDRPDWKLLRSHLQREGRVAKEDVIQIVNEMNKIFSIIKKLILQIC